MNRSNLETLLAAIRASTDYNHNSSEKCVGAIAHDIIGKDGAYLSEALSEYLDIEIDVAFEIAHWSFADLQPRNRHYIAQKIEVMFAK